MALDFSTIGAQLSFWLSHIGQGFKGGYSGSGENGIDIPMPTGTPVYALTSGPVVGQGYYGGGGVVSVKEKPGQVWYYQHLDLIEPSIANGSTKQVQKGQLLGWSGGQTGYGAHPVTSLAYSNDGSGHGWPHIEVGVNAPWQGIWGPAADKGPNVDPVPLLRQMNNANGSIPTGQPLTNTISNPLDWLGQLKKQFSTLFAWLSDPMRFLKLIGGTLLIGVGIVLFILPGAIGPGLQIAGAATGNPAMAGVGAALTKRPDTLLARGAEGYGKGLAATRHAKEQGRLAGVEQEQKAMKAELSRRAKKGAATRKANKVKQAQAAKPAPAPAAEAEEPVFVGGKQVGTMRAGKLMFNQSRAVPEAQPTKSPSVPAGGLTPEDARRTYKDAAAKKEQARQQGRKFINPLE